MSRLFLLSAAFAASLPVPAPAGEHDVSAMVQAEILPGWREADGTHMAALRLRLAPGWKTFWRAPGDAGIPARFDLDPSDNLGGLEPVWPVPEVFDVAGMRTIGYRRELVLPLRIAPERADEPVMLSGEVALGICSDVCVPATLALQATLPVTGARDPQIVTALIDRPYSAAEAGVGEVVCATAPVQYGVGFRSEITLPAMGGDETVVIEPGDPDVWVGPTRSWWEGPVLVTETELSHVDGPGVRIAARDIRITVIGDGAAVEIDGCPAP